MRPVVDDPLTGLKSLVLVNFTQLELIGKGFNQVGQAVF